MEIINITFRLGIIIGIFAFIWSLVRLGVLVLSGGQPLQVWQHYLMKLIQYFFLIQVTFLFCFETNTALSLSQSSTVVTFIILLIYFVSKLQNNQNRRFMISMMRNQQMANPQKTGFDLRIEIGLIVVSLTFFIACIYFPYLAENRISNWMKDAIINIEDTPIFGFIFKIVGFFFLFSIFNKIVQSVVMLIAPKQINQDGNSISSQKENDDFDDFEDVSEN